MPIEVVDAIEITIMTGTITSVIIIWYYSHKQLGEIKNQMWIVIYSNYTRRYADIISKFPENINEDNFVINPGSDGYNEVMRTIRLYFDLCYEEYSLFHIYKKIDKQLWDDWEEGIEASLNKKAFKDSWVIIHKDTVYSTEFDKFIQNTIIKAEDSPDQTDASDVSRWMARLELKTRPKI